MLIGSSGTNVREFLIGINTFSVKKLDLYMSSAKWCPLCLGLNNTAVLVQIRARRLTSDQPWWRHQMEPFPHYWPFVREIRRPPVNSPHKGQWRGALMFSLICAWTNSWANIGDAGDLRPHCAYYDVTVMTIDDLATDADMRHSAWMSWYLKCREV